MNLRDRRESLDRFEILIRESLVTRAAQKPPSPELRRSLLQRAGRQQRRLPWRLPIAFPGLFNDQQSHFAHQTAQHNLLYIESLFGPRMGWFSFNQLMR